MDDFETTKKQLQDLMDNIDPATVDQVKFRRLVDAFRASMGHGGTRLSGGEIAYGRSYERSSGHEKGHDKADDNPWSDSWSKAMA